LVIWSPSFTKKNVRTNVSSSPPATSRPMVTPEIPAWTIEPWFLVKKFLAWLTYWLTWWWEKWKGPLVKYRSKRLTPPESSWPRELN
jgi:hypothetical protein